MRCEDLIDLRVILKLLGSLTGTGIALTFRKLFDKALGDLGRKWILKALLGLLEILSFYAVVSLPRPAENISSWESPLRRSEGCLSAVPFQGVAISWQRDTPETVIKIVIGHYR